MEKIIIRDYLLFWTVKKSKCSFVRNKFCLKLVYFVNAFKWVRWIKLIFSFLFFKTTPLFYHKNFPKHNIIDQKITYLMRYFFFWWNTAAHPLLQLWVVQSEWEAFAKKSLFWFSAITTLIQSPWLAVKARGIQSSDGNIQSTYRSQAPFFKRTKIGY